MEGKFYVNQPDQLTCKSADQLDILSVCTFLVSVSFSQFLVGHAVVVRPVSRSVSNSQLVSQLVGQSVD